MPTNDTADPARAVELPPLLVSAAAAAKMLGISQASWWRHQAAGKVPAPQKLGKRTLWRRADLERWVGLGLPDRKTFEALQAAEAAQRNGRRS